MERKRREKEKGIAEGKERERRGKERERKLSDCSPFNNI
jgi:hypothetical protein